MKCKPRIARPNEIILSKNVLLRRAIGRLYTTWLKVGNQEFCMGLPAHSAFELDEAEFMGRMLIKAIRKIRSGP